LAKPTSNSTLRLPPEVKALLRSHAHIRNVHVSELTQDILRGWCAAVTDWEHPYFRRDILGFGRIPGVPARYPGYAASMGFRDASFRHDAPPDPSDGNPMRYHADHYTPVAESDADELLVVDVAELTKLQHQRMAEDLRRAED
jgi:hypothetical protein